MLQMEEEKSQIGTTLQQYFNESKSQAYNILSNEKVNELVLNSINGTIQLNDELLESFSQMVQELHDQQFNNLLQKFDQDIQMIKQLIYYFLVPLNNLHCRLSQELFDKQPTQANLKKKPIMFIQDATEQLLNIVYKKLGEPRLIKVTQKIYNSLAHLRDLQQLDDTILNQMRNIILFYHVCQYSSQAKLVRRSEKEYKWIVSNKKTDFYINYFETNYLTQIDSYYTNKIQNYTNNFSYDVLLEWIGNSMKFETEVNKKIFIFSEKELISTIKVVLLSDQLKKLLIDHDKGPKFMFQNQQFGKLEQIIRILSVDVESVKKFSEAFEQYLKEKGKQNIKQYELDYQSNKQCLNIYYLIVSYEEAIQLYDQSQTLLNEANQICEQINNVRMVNQEICRSEMLKARDQAFNFLLTYKQKLVDAIALLVDSKIRKNQDLHETGEKLKYLLSVYENNTRFFKQHNKMLCQRMIDNSRKYYQTDQDMINILKERIQNLELISIQKVLNDAHISQLINENLRENIEIKQYIRSVSILFINETALLQSQSYWVIPQKSMEELVQRRKKNQTFTQEQQTTNQAQKIQMEELMEDQDEQPEQQQTKKKRQTKKSEKVTKRGNKKKQEVQMEIEEEVKEKEAVQLVQIDPIEKQMNTLKDIYPEYIKNIFIATGNILTQFKDHRYLSYPLLSLGLAEIVFHSEKGDYYLQVSTIQMIFLLLLQEGIVDAEKKLKEIACFSVDEDINYLIEKNILTKDLQINYGFEEKIKKIKCRPQKINKQINMLDQLFDFQILCQAQIIKQMKQSKTILITQLVNLVYKNLSSRINCYVDLVSLHVQQMIQEGNYLKIDEKDSLKVHYLVT